MSIQSYIIDYTPFAVPPISQILVDNVNVLQPDVAMIMCSAMGRPRPAITWYRIELDNSRTIISGTANGVSISESNGDAERTTNSTLTFHYTRPSFSTMYICEARNPVSSAETNGTLTVLGKYIKYSKVCVYS